MKAAADTRMEDKAEDSQEKGGKSAPQGLNQWVDTLGEKGMPVFAHTVQDIAGTAGDSESSASELARVVLQDAAMTARLLRVANSPYYSPASRNISTVSRAVVLMGFNTVRSMCLSLAVVESLKQGAHKDRIAGEMARSFHAAVQARSFAEQRRDACPEEVYIATLLYRLGDMAFWSQDCEAVSQLDDVLRKTHGDRSTLQRRLLGFDLNELTQGLSKHWGLGELLDNALAGKVGADPRASSVVLGHKLAEAVEKGWDKPELQELMERTAEMLYLPLEEVTAMVHDNATMASKTASYYGAEDAAKLIPLPPSQQKAGAKTAAVKAEEERESRFLEPDPLLQLGILRELSSMIDGGQDINLLIEMALEGILRGIGMDRTLFALLTAGHKQLRARYALGWDKEDMRTRFVFDNSPLKANIFTHALERGDSLWVGADLDRMLRSLITDEVQTISGDAPFFVSPVLVKGKPIGLFYADRRPSGRPLSDDEFQSFRHFCQQARIALCMARGGG